MHGNYAQKIRNGPPRENKQKSPSLSLYTSPFFFPSSHRKPCALDGRLKRSRRERERERALACRTLALFVSRISISSSNVPSAVRSVAAIAVIATIVTEYCCYCYGCPNFLQKCVPFFFFDPDHILPSRGVLLTASREGGLRMPVSPVA